MEITKRESIIFNIILCSMFFNQYVEFSVVSFVALFIWKLKFNSKLIFVGIVISIYSIVMIIINNYNLSHFFTRGLACIIMILFYSSLIENFLYCIPYIWKQYCKICYYASLIGLLQVIFSILFKINIFYLFNSYPLSVSGLYQPPTATLLETADFACLLTPSFVYSLFESNSISEINKKEWVILLNIILCFSSLAILGVLVSLIFYYWKQWRQHTHNVIIVLIILVLSIFTGINVLNQEYQTKDANTRDYKSIIVKFNQSVDAFQHIDDITFMQEYNLSTFATYSNLSVALQAPNRISGTGLGTHEDNYYKVFGKASFEQMERAFGLNSEDAYSLFTRLLSEMGVVGILLYLFFVYKKFQLSNPISMALFINIIMHLVGNGNYFINGFALFNVMYYWLDKLDLDMDYCQLTD